MGQWLGHVPGCPPRLVIYLVIYLPGVVPTRLEERRSPLFTTWQKTIGLVGVIREETHLCDVNKARTLKVKAN